MIEQVTLLMIGFSVLSASVLLLAYAFFLPDMRKTTAGIVACIVLLAALAGLQWHHLQYLLHDAALFGARLYLVLLVSTPPAFYFFSRELLLPDNRKSILDLLHCIPPVASLFLPAGVIAPIAFLIGAGYSIWLARLVYGMREQSRRFRFEMFFFALFAILAVLVLGLGATLPYANPGAFYVAYANSIGIAFVLVVAALIIFPEIMGDIAEAAKATYANSTLGGIDVDDALRRLDRLMVEDKLFQNENLNLKLVAEAMELSGHQLSELINSQFGHGFSRYVREQRVAEAKRLLREDARSSILSVSMTTGFKSQSSFYAAFKEITGQAPGRFREQAHSNTKTS